MNALTAFAGIDAIPAALVTVILILGFAGLRMAHHDKQDRTAVQHRQQALSGLALVSTYKAPTRVVVAHAPLALIKAKSA